MGIWILMVYKFIYELFFHKDTKLIFISPKIKYVCLLSHAKKNKGRSEIIFKKNYVL